MFIMITWVRNFFTDKRRGWLTKTWSIPSWKLTSSYLKIWSVLTRKLDQFLLENLINSYLETWSVPTWKCDNYKQDWNLIFTITKSWWCSLWKLRLGIVSRISVEVGWPKPDQFLLKNFKVINRTETW